MLHRTPRAPSVCRATVATALALSLSFPGVLSGGAVDPEATPQAPEGPSSRASDADAKKPPEASGG